MLNLPTTEERLGKSPQRLVRYFALLMAVVYFGLGVWLWLTADHSAAGAALQLSPTWRRVLGAVFVIYGTLRFYRGFKTHFTKKQNLADE